MRKPAERIDGRYKNELTNITLIAENVVDNLIKEYPDTDIIDIEYMFMKELGFKFAMANLKENATTLFS